jgi:hypothetical protein
LFIIADEAIATESKIDYNNLFFHHAKSSQWLYQLNNWHIAAREPLMAKGPP